MTTESPCGFDGNADTYGLGVRLGIYLSWIYIILASGWLLGLRADIINAFVVFASALFSATVLVTVLRDETHVVKIIIMQYIFFGGIAVTGVALIARPAPGTPPYYRVSSWRGFLMCLCATGMAIRGLWFYSFASSFKDTPYSKHMGISIRDTRPFCNTKRELIKLLSSFDTHL